ncbi:hypothetical protein GQ457_17G011290 [Hibiscus cannabinus]
MVVDFESVSSSSSSNNSSSQVAMVATSPMTFVAPTFTTEQYNQILGLLHSTSDSSVNLAGMMNRTIPVVNSSVLWILDTCATDHIISDFESLSSHVLCPKPHFIHLPNGKIESVSHTSSHSLASDFLLTKVLFVPNFSYNLLSVSRLAKDHCCVVSFFPDLCILQDRFTGKIMGIGRESKGLYYFESAKGADGLYVSISPTSSLFSSSLSTQNDISSTNSSSFMSNSLQHETSLWHARLGHVSLTTMNKMHFANFVDHACVQNCTICPLAKQTRLPFPTSTSRSAVPFELIHIDLWGPYRVSTHSHHRYFLTIVDDCSRMTWVYLLRVKNDDVLYLKQFLTLVKTQFSSNTKIIRSDNGTEFFNSACSTLFTTLGLVHQSSCVHTPQQNGVVERKHRHLLEVARALRFQSNVPIKFWGECILDACFLINRLPSSVLQWKTPFECLYNKHPNLNILKVFGCLCYATTPHQNDKFAPRAIPSVFMGYSNTQKGYLLFNLEQHKFFVNRDVKFFEQVFPFKFPITKSSPFFPVSSQVPDSEFLKISEQLTEQPPLNTDIPFTTDSAPISPASSSEQPTFSPSLSPEQPTSDQSLPSSVLPEQSSQSSQASSKIQLKDVQFKH